MSATSKILTLVIIAFFPLFSAGYEVEEIEVFTSSNRALEILSTQLREQRRYKLTIHDMNKVERLEDELSKGLSGIEEEALDQVNKMIEKMGKDAFNQKILEAHSPLLRAVAIGLNEYPSVVINGTYVVYGTDNIEIAKKRFKKWVLSRR